MTLRGPIAALLIACLGLAACTAEDTDEADGVVPLDPGDAGQGTEEAPSQSAAPTPEPTPAPEDPYAVPDEIDAAYLDRVFEALNAVVLDAQVLLVQDSAYSDSIEEVLSAVFSDYALDDQRSAYHEMVRTGDFPHYAGGPLVTRTQRVVHVEGPCVAALTEQDRSEMLLNAPEPTLAYSLLHRRPVEASRSVNPTPWTLAARIRSEAVAPHQEDQLCAELLSSH